MKEYYLKILLILCFTIFSVLPLLAQKINHTTQTTDSLPKVERLLVAAIYEQRADSFLAQKNLKSAEFFYETSYQSYFMSDSLLKAGAILLRLASIYHQADLLNKAEERVKQANVIFKAVGDTTYELQSLVLLAEYMFSNKNWTKFEQFAATILEKADPNVNNNALAKLNWMQGMRYHISNPKLAKQKFNTGIARMPEQSSYIVIADLKFALGKILITEKKVSTALLHFQTALLHYKENNNFKKEAETHFQIGKCHLLQNKKIKAEDSFMKAFSFSISFHFHELASKSSLEIAHIYKKRNLHKRALESYSTHLNYSDSAYITSSKNNLQLIKDKYDIKKRDEILNLQLADLKLQEEIEKVWNTRFVLVGIFAFVLIFSIAFVSYTSRVKLNRNSALTQANAQISKYNRIISSQQNELENEIARLTENKEEILVHSNMLSEQTIYLNDQKEYVSKQQTNLINNLEFAFALQASMMPPARKMQALLRNHFLINLPQNVVSGDFYWIKRLNSNRVIFLVADSTGHGVPGALLSVLGLAFLNDIIREKPVQTASEVLEKLRKKIKYSLRTSAGNVHKDGFDLSACILDKTKKELQLAGALSPIYLVRRGELTVHKPDRFPVGSHLTFERPFSNTIIPYEHNDMLYMFSDGIKDQFGGPLSKKFGSKRFRELLTNIAYESAEEQKEIVTETIEKWKGSREQTDDMILLGVRL